MCGIVGLIGAPEAAQEAFLGLTTLQHRGQDGAGILTYDSSPARVEETGFHRVKNLGLVESVFTRENMSKLTGSMAIAHTRYSTVGRGDLIDVQPFLLNYPFGLGIVHNGNLVNHLKLAEELRTESRRHLLTRSDTEVLLNVFAEGLSVTEQADRLSFDEVCRAVQTVFRRAVGSYSCMIMVADQGLVAFRDPQGIRPLVLGHRPGRRAGEKAAYAMASESAALSFMGYEPLRDVKPGEAVFIDIQGNLQSRLLIQEDHRPCMFEWVYFASPESVLDGVPVYGTRIGLGKHLATQVKKSMEELGLEADMIVPIPESARIAAIALAEELKIPYREVLIKNRYIKRTFILDSQDKRQSAVSLKLSPVRSEMQGKKVLLIDDSIVRGTTSKKIVDLVRRAGAASVYFVSTCPPILHPCYYGIDFPVQSELLAHGRTHSEIEKELGADAVIYQDIEGLLCSIREAGTDKRLSPCMACLDGKYPTDVSSGQKFAGERAKDRGGK